MEVENPIFIIGTGRCGSTIFHELISYHPYVTWLSMLNTKYRDKPEINKKAMALVNLPLVYPYVRKKIYPSEWYPFWDFYYSGFSEPCRDLYKEDVSNRTKVIIRRVMSRMLSPKRPRLQIKITGWPRVGFLKEIFPDAKFIHIYRDGRSVVNSWLTVRWWSGWRGPENWRWGELTTEQRQKWERFNKSFLVLAAIEWEILMDAHEKVKPLISPSDFMEVCYEDFCKNPIQTLRTTTDFFNLEWHPSFETKIKKIPIKSANEKWKKDLTLDQQKTLCECLGDTLQKYGYT